MAEYWGVQVQKYNEKEAVLPQRKIQEIKDEQMANPKKHNRLRFLGEDNTCIVGSRLNTTERKQHA